MFRKPINPVTQSCDLTHIFILKLGNLKMICFKIFVSCRFFILSVQLLGSIRLVRRCPRRIIKCLVVLCSRAEVDSSVRVIICARFLYQVRPGRYYHSVCRSLENLRSPNSSLSVRDDVDGVDGVAVFHYWLPAPEFRRPRSVDLGTFLLRLHSCPVSEPQCEDLWQTSLATEKMAFSELGQTMQQRAFFRQLVWIKTSHRL